MFEALLSFLPPYPLRSDILALECEISYSSCALILVLLDELPVFELVDDATLVVFFLRISRLRFTQRTIPKISNNKEIITTRETMMMKYI